MVDPPAHEHPQSSHSELANRIVVMAHDLKNVLAALSANLHFLEGTMAESGDDEAIDALNDSLTLCQVLDHFLRNLDLIGREDLPTLAIHKTLNSLRAVADDVVARFQRQAHTSGVELHVRALGDRDAHAYVDRELFTRAADNLLRTTLEQSRRGTVITVSVEGNGNASTLTVSDSQNNDPNTKGRSGMDAHSSGEKPQGRGLGMYCARLSAHAAGANLNVEQAQHGYIARLEAPAKP